MDYFTNVLFTFLDLGTLQLCCCLWRDLEHSDLIKNILICVSEMNEGLTGLERHEGEQLMSRISFKFSVSREKNVLTSNTTA